MPITPPWPIIPPVIEAIVLLRAAQAALARAVEAEPEAPAAVALRDVGAALVALETATLRE